jgi:hypothetical protein
MKPAPFFLVLLLSVVCVVLSVALVFIARANQQVQAGLQAKQQQLNSGILGPQGQQIGNSLLQDMANSAARSTGMRKLLEKHGYQIPPPEAPAAVATNQVESAATPAVKDESKTEPAGSK